ncbi:glycosyltransferase [Pseudokineococcus marinus]|uniref:Glycosyltransferase n=1 Tax=Pseudokineococcus marinus TaxID=351215 RepID=A0A849BPI0_9ACTN|nr:glycosyltransferase [Pseudokineococcus marinus]NNH23253.1 glycosyltransferase [Pseudokineococcus marinus]
MRVLVVGHTAPGGVFTVGSHHLARELRARGHRVAHLSTPVSLAHALRWRDPEVRRRAGMALRTRTGADGVPALVPLTLLPTSAGPVHLGPLSLRTAVPPLRRRLADLGLDDVDVLLVDQPLAAGVERLVRARAVVYRSTDIVESAAKVRAEQRLLRRVDALVATSSVVLERLRAVRPDVPSLVLDNGVDFGRFDSSGGAVERRGAVYVGAVDDRFDWDALAAMARGRPDLPVDVYGPTTVPVPALPDNVVVHGGVAYERTPGLMRQALVGLLPLRRTDLNRGRSPMKLFEYLASGLQVVSTLPPSVRPAPPGVHVAAAPGEEDAALARAVGAGVNHDGVRAAREMDWADRAARLEGFLEGLLDGPRP